jgi:UDP-glucose:glycoprotein glucosyltransferase
MSLPVSKTAIYLEHYPHDLYELEIGVQAAQLIADSPNALNTLKRLSQDFPKYAASISRRVVTKSEIRDEIQANSRKARPGINALWLNGANVEDTQMNPFP